MYLLNSFSLAVERQRERERISRFNMTTEKTDKQMSSGHNSGEKAPAFTKPLTICATSS
jgi:hypothetical protein